MQKTRLDIILSERGLVESRSLAQRLIMAGQVRVDDQVVLKPATKIDVHADVTVDFGPKFVSRGGQKLEPALITFGLDDLTGKICVDVGASTGGFTDCLLQHNAQHVYAVDVGQGILHWKLRNDARVTVMEKTNARFLEEFPEAPQLVTIDASFISLKILLPVIKRWFSAQGGDIVALIKPQFEAGKKEAAKGDGVIRDPEIHKRVIVEMLEFAENEHFEIRGLVRSVLLGPKGNTEFLVHLSIPKKNSANIDEIVARLFVESKDVDEIS
jgi:23S rRNA (cytidine1920-2'-O)/16S rRNA (cytidine1409-2'-O)-methyltransferase